MKIEKQSVGIVVKESWVNATGGVRPSRPVLK